MIQHGGGVPGDPPGEASGTHDSRGVPMRGARFAKTLVLVLGGFCLFGGGCFSTTTAQGLAQTSIQTVIQTLISLFVTSVVTGTAT
jgi:hypothetical protein